MKKHYKPGDHYFHVALLRLQYHRKKNDTLKVLQLNLWGQGETVPNGVKGIVDIIDQTDPDIAFLCEIFSQKRKTLHGLSHQ